MDAEKQRKLEQAGWSVGSAETFLGLSAEESLLVALRLVLAQGLRRKRQELRLTQRQGAELMGSSQSRVARAETADRSVSLDLLIRALLAVGTSRDELARLVARPAAA